MLKITDVKIFKAKKRGAVLAYANVVLDDKFIIRGITLVETEKSGRFISMPSRRLRDRDKGYRDICHPLNAKIRDDLTKTICAAYDEFIESEEK